ncbi:hypothetical protein [Streptomyces sp. KMM 9044]|uniref:hypothetical protein n=1 Tax=Streptomyces sp. KMM 9044 TaxID=2744474 RepID=UPI00215116C4|nr:hypothetical protein [Streptomyces sp. KMM 9044]WAX79541.1 hypothetical protein HUV60_019575 [Streptomyces sp. KMM 9044]
MRFAAEWFSVGGHPVMGWVLVGCMAVVGLMWLAAIVLCLNLYGVRPNKIHQATLVSRATLSHGRESRELQEQVHAAFGESAKRRMESSALMGAIAVATWSVLFIERRPNSPAADLSGISLGLLFLGGFSLIAGRFFFRGEKTQFGMLARSAAFYMGCNALLLSFCAIVIDLIADGFVQGLALVVAVAAAVRDFWDSGQELRWVRRYRSEQRAPAPTAEQPDVARGWLPVAVGVWVGYGVGRRIQRLRAGSAKSVGAGNAEREPDG